MENPRTKWWFLAGKIIYKWAIFHGCVKLPEGMSFAVHLQWGTLDSPRLLSSLPKLGEHWGSRGISLVGNGFLKPQEKTSGPHREHVDAFCVQKKTKLLIMYSINYAYIIIFWLKYFNYMNYIWANYNNSLTWIVRPFGDDFPNPFTIIFLGFRWLVEGVISYDLSRSN